MSRTTFILILNVYGHSPVTFKMSMITASTWVPRGAAANFPTKYDIDEAELSRISKLAKLQLEDANHDLDHARNGEVDGSSTSGSDGEQTSAKIPKSQE